MTSFGLKHNAITFVDLLNELVKSNEELLLANINKEIDMVQWRIIFRRRQEIFERMVVLHSRKYQDLLELYEHQQKKILNQNEI